MPRMKTVREVSALTGVSIRALHHYDAIGLLKPTFVTEAGYRLYDDEALRRLSAILFFRELDLPLREIGQIFDSPRFDPREALRDQLKLLELRRDRLDGLIRLAKAKLEEGVDTMDFSAFSAKEYDAYMKEAREKWGDTQAYREYEARGKNGDASEGAALLTAQFAAFGALRNGAPDSEAAQQAVEDLQKCITAHFYTCTDEILAGLGEMYAADERFRANIDRAGGEGTAEFVRDAIRCKLKNAEQK